MKVLPVPGNRCAGSDPDLCRCRWEWGGLGPPHPCVLCPCPVPRAPARLRQRPCRVALCPCFCWAPGLSGPETTEFLTCRPPATCPPSSQACGVSGLRTVCAEQRGNCLKRTQAHTRTSLRSGPGQTSDRGGKRGAVVVRGDFSFVRFYLKTCSI